MLIIPTIRLHDRICRDVPQGAEGTDGLYPTHPEHIVRMWRGENAKALAIVDEDGLDTGVIGCADLIAAMADATDIPIILLSGFVRDDDVRHAFERLGCYRVVLPEAVCTYERLALLLHSYSPRRIAVGVHVDTLEEDAAHAGELERLLERLRALEQCGVERVVISVRDGKGPPPLALLLRVVQHTRLSCTVRECVHGYEDLNLLQRLSPRRVDSLMLDDALYANAFPCQRIWRLAEKQLIEEGRLT